jgi:hypothetical protein
MIVRWYVAEEEYKLKEITHSYLDSGIAPSPPSSEEHSMIEMVYQPN